MVSAGGNWNDSREVVINNFLFVQPFHPKSRYKYKNGPNAFHELMSLESIMIQMYTNSKLKIAHETDTLPILKYIKHAIK